MHIVKDENGNICGHAHEHDIWHTHTYEHNHVHSHEHGHEDDHHHDHTQTGEAVHCHGSEGHCHSHEGHCHGQEGHCHSHESQAAPANQNEALLQYMLDHNTHHAGRTGSDGTEAGSRWTCQCGRTDSQGSGRVPEGQSLFKSCVVTGERIRIRRR